jgi:hypothetical protein
MASWLPLRLPSFPWLPPPPPPGSFSGRGGGGGEDDGDWRPNVIVAVAGAHLGRALRRRFVGLLSSPVPLTASPLSFHFLALLGRNLLDFH